MIPHSRSWSAILVLMLVAVLLIGFIPDPARAVGNTLYVKIAATGTGDCSLWANACTLQTALTNAVSGDQIWVAAGTHIPSTTGDRSATFHLKDGVAVYGGFVGTEISLDQRNWTANVVTLSGDLNGDDNGFTNNSENSYHVTTGASGATLDGVIIRGGADGGMYNFSSSPTLNNVTFTGNTASLGGGIYNENSSPTLSNVTLSGNDAWHGGGIYNKNSRPTLSNVTFNGNSAVLGAGMYNFSSSPTLSNDTFIGNSALKGGGIYNENSSPTLSNVTFSGNNANGGHYDGDGGGMLNAVNSNPTLNNVTFSGNSADWGGGMVNENSNPTLSNVTFNGNSAYIAGGGMLNNASKPTLTNVTFSGNSANTSGGGIYNVDASTPTLLNSILWGDKGGEIIYDFGSITVNFSDVQGGYPGMGNIDADPLLAPLGSYGGIVQTMALLPGSPVVDATSSNCPATDARGVARSSPNCDLGAFETQGFTLTKTGGDAQSTPILTDFAQPLCVTVTAKNAGEHIDGGMVTFTPPAIGTSATMSSNPVMITGGAACTSAHANVFGGSYNIAASATGAADVTFRLTNISPIKIYLPFLSN